MLCFKKSVCMKLILRNIVVAIITWEARMVLKKYKPKIIAITGSVGKTSTKDAIYTALERSLFVRKSEKSFNSEIGVPLTILGCQTGWSNPFKWIRNIFEGLALILLANHYPKWLVLEVGTDKPGDIQELTTWLKPDVVVITALPDVPVHVENFRRVEDVTREKRALAEALKEDGVLLLGGDDKNTVALKKDFADKKVLLYGVEAHNDVSASHISVTYGDAGEPTGMQFNAGSGGSDISMTVRGRLGHHQIYPVLAALAVGEALDISSSTIIKTLEKDSGPRGRMRLLEGHNNSTIIDDSYNSSPAALRAALTTLKKVETTGRKIAVLGDMLELGRFSADAHKKAGVQAAGVVDALITVGVRAKGIAEAAREAGLSAEYIQEFDTGESQEAGRVVRAMLEEGDVVLVKGSQSGIRLEKAIKEVLLEPQQASKLLVRQEAEWLEM